MRSIGEILDTIKRHKGLKADADLARLFGKPRSTISMWRKRGNMPYKEVAALCERENISGAWLFAGQIPVEYKQVDDQKVLVVAEGPGLYKKDVEKETDLREIVAAVTEIMGSDDETTKAALKMNVVAFKQAIYNRKEVAGLKRDLEAIKKVLNPVDCPTDAKEE
jgi:hypothetical protein